MRKGAMGSIGAREREQKTKYTDQHSAGDSAVGTITARIVGELLLGCPGAVGRSGRSEQVTLRTAIKE